MILKVFTQPSCSKCPAAKALARQLKAKSLKLKIEEYDVTGADGLAEASFYTVLSTPGMILCDDNGKEIKGWRGKIPGLEEVMVHLKEILPKPLIGGFRLGRGMTPRGMNKLLEKRYGEMLPR